MAKMVTPRPVAKVTAATLAAVVGTLLVWILNMFLLPPERQLDDTMQGAITTLLVGLAGYFTHPAPRDQIVSEVPLAHAGFTSVRTY